MTKVTKMTTRLMRILAAKHFSRWMCAIVICAAMCVVSAVGCGWYGGVERSVRFNINFTERELSRLPPVSEHLRDDYEYRNSDVGDELFQRAATAEEQGDLVATRKLLRIYLERALSSSAVDRLDALTALDKGASISVVRHYLAARAAYDKLMLAVEQGDKLASVSPNILPATSDRAAQNFKSIETALGADGVRSLAIASSDRRLADNCLYLRAAVHYRARDFTEAATLFRQLVKHHPNSEKLEAALYMAGLSSLKSSSSYNGVSAVSSPCGASCVDESWQNAQAAFTRIVREYAGKHHSSRYRSDAHGWLGYLYLRVGRTAEGLSEYYRLLDGTHDKSARINALTSLRLARSSATFADMEQLESLLADEPAAALAYTYHNLYNYTFSTYLAIADDKEQNSSGSDSSYSAYYGARDDLKRKNAAEQTELQRIARFAHNLMKRFPRTPLEASFALRVAEAHLELGEHAVARSYAARALQMKLSSEDRAEALWVRGVAEHQLKRIEAARQTFLQLVTYYPNDRLTEGARRLLAMAAEDAGDRGAALEQYLALDYREDVAYFIDVLMTPEQLAAFIESHPNVSQRDQLLYALGVRYLRENRFSEARATYARVRAQSQNHFLQDAYFDDHYPSMDCSNYVLYYGCRDPKMLVTDMPGVRVEWIMRDQQTIDELEKLYGATQTAQGDEAKAEAQYQLASYLYEASTLLFYNSAAWQSGRYGNLEYLHTSRRYRAPNEAQTLWQYMQRHEPVAQALEIYLNIVRQHPQTRAARDALYTAAVCHERLATYNSHWRSLYELGLHAGERIVTYKDVRAMYPRYQLPRATAPGWVPSTRTVNGGSGWASPPKRQPRLTRTERVQRGADALWQHGSSIFTRGWSTIVNFWEQKLKRALMLVVLLLTLIHAARLAGRTRRTMRTHLASCTRYPALRHGAAAGWRRYIGLAVKKQKLAPPRREYRDQVWVLSCAVLRATLRCVVRPLVADKHGRAALWQTLAAHGLLALSLLWLIRTISN